MKKTLLACALCSSFIASNLQAATLLGMKAGADYWHTDVNGQLAIKDTAQQDFDYSAHAQGSVWFALEHPVPLLPNVGLRLNRVSSDGHATTEASTTRTDLSNLDLILYYELLDNDIVSLDLGGAYKQMDGEIKLMSLDTYEREQISSGILMGYVDAKASLPTLDLYGFAQIMQGVNESGVYDYSIGLGWQFEGLALDYNLRAGYREFLFDVNDFSGVSSDLKAKGFFAGVELVF